MNPRTGLPMHSSPAPPLKRNQLSFDFDASLCSVAALRNALGAEGKSDSSDSEGGAPPLCKSAPASTCLLGNFEESALAGRLTPFGKLDGFEMELAASGAFCPPHHKLSLTTVYFNTGDDAPSPYLGYCSLEPLGRKGYHIPKRGLIQVVRVNKNLLKPISY